MKSLNFDEVDNRYGSGRYEIDWEVGERKYKVPYRGICVYENGPTEVTNYGARSPYWRREVFRDYGLDFRLFSHFQGYRFFCPNTGGKVIKGSLEAGRSYLFDKGLGRLYAGRTFTFISEHAQPTSNSEVVYRVPNKARYAAKMEEFAPHFALGETLVALHGASGYLGWYFWENEIPKDLATESARKFCIALASNRLGAEKALRYQTQDIYRSPYLIVRSTT